MKQEEALQHMQEIQRIMERTTLYTLLPGTPALIGGALALAGCAISYRLIGSVDLAHLLTRSYKVQLGFCIMWTIIGIVAIAQDVALSTMAALKHGVSPMSRPGRFAAYSLCPSVVVAVVVTVKLLTDLGAGVAGDQALRYIGPIWMMCYGTGIYAAGLFSVRLPRLLGLAFITLGTAGCLFLDQYGLALIALSFGLLHIVFGLEVIRRGRRSHPE